MYPFVRDGRPYGQSTCAIQAGHQADARVQLVGDNQVVVLVNCNSVGEPELGARSKSAIPTSAGDAATGDRVDVAASHRVEAIWAVARAVGFGHQADPVVQCVGDQEVTGSVDGNGLRGIQLGMRRRSEIPAVTGNTVAGDRVDIALGTGRKPKGSVA